MSWSQPAPRGGDDICYVPPPSQMTLADIPPRIGLLPLRGILLLPRTQLPLRIFEPRYIALIDYALAHGRLIGLIQPALDSSLASQEKAERHDTHHVPLERTGTLGRITSFLECRDGTFSLILTGICRFYRLRDHDTPYGWREAVIDSSAFGHDLLTENPAPMLDREKLTRALEDYFEYHHLKTNWHTLQKLGNEELLTTLPMALPLTPAAKQALLEAPNLNARAMTLFSILEQNLNQ